MEFKIVDPKSMHKNTLRGFFTLAVGPLEITGFSYHVQGDKSWVSFPARPYLDPETNEQKYSQIVRIPDERRYYKFQAWATKQAKELFREVEPEPERVPAPEMDDIPF